MKTQRNIMMVIALLLVAGGVTIQAQETTNILKDNSEWNILWQSTGVPTPELVTESLMISCDTLVDGVLYKKVLRKLSSETQYWHGSLDYDLYGIIKEEESGKVFYKPKEQEVEYLLYDFGMNVNDTAVMYWCQNPNCEVHVRIDSIATQHIAGAERRVFYVSSKDMYGDEWHWLNTWVEGIGAMEGLLYSCNVVNAGGITLHKLLCYHKDGELLYINEDYNSCLIDTNPTSITEESKLTLFYDPCSQQLLLSDFANKTKLIMVYEIFGRMVFHQKIINENAINLSFLPQGTYLVKYQTEKASTIILKIIK